MLGFLTLLKESWGIKMSERQADSMKGPLLLEVFLPWLKNNDFFCLPGARNKHSCIPSVLSFPSNLQTGHKGFSVPSLNHISHSDVLPVWGSISYFHLVLSFPVWASKFVYFQVSHIFLFLNCFSLRDNLHVSLLFPFAPSLLCSSYYPSSSFLFVSLPALISLSPAPISSPWFSCSHRDALWPDILSLLPTQSNWRNLPHSNGTERAE